MNILVALFLSQANAVPLITDTNTVESMGTQTGNSVNTSTEPNADTEITTEFIPHEPLSNRRIVNYNGIVVEESVPESEDTKEVSISYNVGLELGNRPKEAFDLLVNNELLGYEYHDETGIITKQKIDSSDPEADESRLKNYETDDQFDETGIELHDRSSFKTNSYLVGLSLSYILFFL